MIVNPNKPRNKKIEGKIIVEAENNKGEEKNKIEPRRDIVVNKKNENAAKKQQYLVGDGGFAIRMVIYAVSILAGFILFGMISVVLMVGPVVSKEKNLPPDFPQDLPLYLPQQASVKTQDQIQRQKLIQTIESLPNWFITPFLSRFSVDLKGQILLGDGKERVYDANSLKKSLESSLGSSVVISLKWKKIDKTRKSLEEYYVKKLQEAKFSAITEHRGQETLIIFSKNKIRGVFLLADNFTSKESSNISLVVAY